MAIPLKKALMLYGYEHCPVVILEGIMRASWYQSLFKLANTLYGEKVYSYYFDL